MKNTDDGFIVVAGSLNQDLFISCDRLPLPGETHPVESLTIAPGGKGANQAAQSSLLGAPVYMFGAVGKDRAGEDLMESLSEAGVRTDPVIQKDTTTGTCIINVLPDGTVFGNLVAGANGALRPEDIEDSRDLFRKASLVILQMEIPNEVNERIMDLVHEGNGKILLNTAPAREVPDSFLEKADYVILNENEASFYLDREVLPETASADARELQERLGNTVILTIGENGSVICTPQEEFSVSARKTSAVDTTGAGDSYIGALAAKLLENTSLKEAAEFASICSSLTVEKLGAQQAMPDMEEVMKA